MRDIFYNDDIVAGIVLKEVNNAPIYIPLLGRTQEPAFATWRFAKTEVNHNAKEIEESEEINIEKWKEYVNELNIAHIL